MSTSQLQLVCDSSTYANFFQWASAVSASFAAFGWAQSTDTGQVMWTGLTISAASQSGSNTTYTYASLTGLALAVGRAVTITAMGNAGNNGTFVITAFTGTTIGTFTVVNASGVTAAAQSGLVTAQAAAPSASAFVSETWTPNDGLATFYLRVEYGNVGTAATPTMRLTLSTSTTGAGVPSGYATASATVALSNFTVPSTSTQYECDFSGAAGRFGAMMWRNAPNSANQLFAVERSVNSSGTYTASYVTLWTVGICNQLGGPSMSSQRSLVFGAGAGPVLSNNVSTSAGGWGVRVPGISGTGSSNTAAFSGSIPFDTPAPLVGYWDYPATVVGAAANADLTEGVTFTVSLYGSTRTYMPGKNGPFSNNHTFANATNAATCLRYD